ncbi:hypothetical protein ACFWFQ_15600 [Nocardia salmonicida]|uniref:hypothetical protein n=1 Tax=Nocardia salmonicida TaxID=53431 RepID=UPI00364AE8BE
MTSSRTWGAAGCVGGRPGVEMTTVAGLIALAEAVVDAQTRCKGDPEHAAPQQIRCHRN